LDFSVALCLRGEIGLAAAALVALLLLLATGLRTRRLSPVGLAKGVALFAEALHTTRYTAAHPQPLRVVYSYDASTRRSHWAVEPPRRMRWTAPFLDGAAPPVPLPPPQAALLEDRTTAGVRSLRLRLTSPRGARKLFLELPDAEPLAVSVDGKPAINLPENGLRLWYHGLRPEGVDVALRLRAPGPLTLRLEDRSDGLPAIPGFPAPRPPELTPTQDGDETRVQATTTLDR
jgi:hypothetical protein